jgi:hypothetical protein
MQAWINSYTPQAIIVLTMPTVDFVDIPQNLKTTNSSTTISVSREFSLNGRIHELLQEYALLKDNWDEEEASAPNPFTLKNAKFLTTLLEKHGQAIFHSAPGPNGEILLDIRDKAKTKSVEIIFYKNRTNVVFFPSEGNPSQEKYEIQNLPRILDWLNETA